MMIPTASLEARYSDEAATAVPWPDALARLAEAEVAWIVTVRPDGRPHATPFVPVVDGAKVYFHVGRGEVKVANLSANPRVLVLVGDTAWDRGLDVTVEGIARPVADDDELRPIAALFRRRWDGRWRLEVNGGVTSPEAPNADVVVFEVTPTQARGHSKGDPFGETRYRFIAGDAPAPEGTS